MCFYLLFYRISIYDYKKRYKKTIFKRILFIYYAYTLIFIRRIFFRIELINIKTLI